MPDLGGFHLLRPWWLAGLPLVAALAWLAGRRHDVRHAWRGAIADHLLDHLVMRTPGDRRPGPRAWLAAVLALACLALSGPSWQREPPAFADDAGQLIIVLDLGESMNAIDVAPTRLARARHKLAELLALRAGARTGLVVFDRSAHRVVAPTDDTALLLRDLAALESDLMPHAAPVPDRMAQALLEARRMLARADNAGPGGAVGTMVLVTDGRDPGPLPDDAGRDVVLWLVGSDAPARLARDSRGPASGLRDAMAPARAATSALDGLPRVAATIDAADVAAVHRRVAQQLDRRRDDDTARAWRDGGDWLLVPLLPLAAIGFRRGWRVRW